MREGTLSPSNANSHIINLDTEPFIPEGWSVEEHQKCGLVDLTKAALYLDESQKNGKVIEGNKLHKKLKGFPVLNAVALEHFLANPHLIPDECKGKAIFFWGTIYRDADGNRCVRSLYWLDGRWRWRCSWLAYVWYGDSPAVLSVN